MSALRFTSWPNNFLIILSWLPIIGRPRKKITFIDPPERTTMTDKLPMPDRDLIDDALYELREVLKNDTPMTLNLGQLEMIEAALIQALWNINGYVRLYRRLPPIES
jgi:hypothetical protein